MNKWLGMCLNIYACKTICNTELKCARWKCISFLFAHAYIGVCVCVSLGTCARMSVSMPNICISDGVYICRCDGISLCAATANAGRSSAAATFTTAQFRSLSLALALCSFALSLDALCLPLSLFNLSIPLQPLSLSLRLARAMHFFNHMCALLLVCALFLPCFLTSSLCSQSFPFLSFSLSFSLSFWSFSLYLACFPSLSSRLARALSLSFSHSPSLFLALFLFLF